MGLVFEAHHKFTRRAVALKLLPGELRGRKEVRSRLLREALALTAVRHPGFVEVLDAGVCGEHGPYVVLEMLDGRTLDGILAARRRLTIQDTVQIGRQVCDAVAYANGRGVIHRDLKPSNVFIARNEIGEEMVKLIDLGVAAVAEEQLEHHDGKLTHAHEVVGTPEYMAPEQLWGREVDARTDVYAIGMTLFECLTGEVPYLGSYPEVLVQVSNAAEAAQRSREAARRVAGPGARDRDRPREGGLGPLPVGGRARARPGRREWPRRRPVRSAHLRRRRGPIQLRTPGARRRGARARHPARAQEGATRRGPAERPQRAPVAPAPVRARSLRHPRRPRRARRRRARGAQRGDQRGGHAGRRPRRARARRAAPGTLREPDDGRDDRPPGERAVDPRGPRPQRHGARVRQHPARCCAGIVAQYIATLPAAQWPAQ